MIRAHEYPVIGVWYWDLEHTERFEVVAEDKKGGLIEIQYFNGEIEELDIDTWFTMRVVSTNAPIDCSGPYEIEKEEQNELNDEPIHPDHWSDPLAPFEDEK